MANFNLKPSELVIGGRSVHYAWVIVGVGAVMRLFSSSFRSSSSILIPRLVDSFGWSYGQVGLGFAIQPAGGPNMPDTIHWMAKPKPTWP